MAKLLADPVRECDISEYLATQSDFAFELKVLSKFCELGWSCLHSGTYEDPVTGKPRQFDIRAFKDRLLSSNVQFRLACSVECKNLRANFPLLVHCMQRQLSECVQSWIWSFPPISRGWGNTCYSFHAMPIWPHQELNIYREGEPVGKATDQIGRRLDGELIDNDADVFEKISQAVNSAHDLVGMSCLALPMPYAHIVSMVVPVLVVPDGSLWTVEYDQMGNITKHPHQVDSVQLYLGKTINYQRGEFNLTYTASHLEIVQFSGLSDLVVRVENTGAISDEAVRRLLSDAAQKANEMSFTVLGSQIVPP